MKKCLIATVFVVAALGGIPAAIALAPGEHEVSKCDTATASATASVPDILYGDGGTRTGTIPGAQDVQTGTKEVCVTATATDSTNTVVITTPGPTTTVTTSVGTTNPPPPPPPPPTKTPPGSLFVRPACTVYASPSGGGDGNSQSSPQTLSQAYSRTVAGSTVCMAPGNYNLASDFNISRSGSSSGYVTYRSLDPANKAAFFASATHSQLVQVFGASWIQFEDVVFDCNNNAAQNGLHINKNNTVEQHVRVIDSYVKRCGAGGIVTSPGMDYLTVVGNKIWRFGDSAGWSSGISFNNNGGAVVADNLPGFHNLIVGNYITGGIDNSSNNSDGNGISIDLGGNIPATLIANNVVYMNGGRCEIDNADTGVHVELNNTCYANGLDTRKTWAEFMQNQNSTGVNWTNNIARAVLSTLRYQANQGNYTVSHDFGYGGTAGNVTGQTVADPLFVNPPAASGGGWQNPPQPDALGDALKLQAASPAVDSCADPRNIPGLDATMLAQINQFALIDIEGTPRPQGAGFDCGGYER